MSDVTRILSAIEKGEAAATSELLPLVYDELRRIAAHKMSAESANHTLQPTALVHEAWMRLVGSEDRQWQNRAHFFGAAAEAMRRILVDHARRKLSQKRGSGLQPEELYESALVLNAPPDELLAVSEALDTLAKQDPEGRPTCKIKILRRHDYGGVRGRHEHRHAHRRTHLDVRPRLAPQRNPKTHLSRLVLHESRAPLRVLI
jgi:RNA polymerase sigma factor (TIGR02999 family)